jgi:hypothetical protein
MKRIIVLLTVATLMLVTSALPALATNFGKEGGGPPLFSGYVGKTLVLHCQVGGGKSVAVFFAKRDEVRGNCQ